MDLDTENSLFAITERQELVRLLWDDIAPTNVLPGIASSPAERRQFVRSMFAFIEGAVWLFKQETLQQHDSGTVTFTRAELALLAELAPVLESDGTVQEIAANLRFTSNLPFTFRCHARAYGYANVLDMGDHRWDLLRRSAQVRNRLMHPKSLASMQVSDEELVAAENSLRWFARTSSLANLEASRWYSLTAAEKIEDPGKANETVNIILAKMDELRNMIIMLPISDG